MKEMWGQWPGWTKDRRWSVHVHCVREVNRWDVETGTTAPCRTFVGDRKRGPLSEVLELAESVAQEHEARNRDRPKPHKVTGVSVFWTCKCKYDGRTIKGWDQEGMANAIVEHLMSEVHNAARRERAAVEAFMNTLGIFDEATEWPPKSP